LAQAPSIHQALLTIATAIQQGNDFSSTVEQAQQRLQKQGFKIDYLELRRESDLKPATLDDDNLVILTAVFLGKARLIDNLAFTLNRTND
jgi:pantoate--beta-alanine ligase